MSGISVIVNATCRVCWIEHHVQAEGGILNSFTVKSNRKTSASVSFEAGECHFETLRVKQLLVLTTAVLLYQLVF